jgi:hypothetical protein
MKKMNNKEFLTRDQIKQKLMGMVVGEYQPIKFVHIITPNPEYDPQSPMEEVGKLQELTPEIVNKMIMEPSCDKNLAIKKVCQYTMWRNAFTQKAIRQNDGTYNYYSEDNIDAIIKFGELHGGGVIEFY